MKQESPGFSRGAKVNHVNLYAQLGDRTSPVVRDALTRGCEICGAAPGDDCTNKMVNGVPLQGRVVHYERVRV